VILIGHEWVERLARRKRVGRHRLLARIVRAGFATANPEIVKAGGRTLSMLRLAITDRGRQALTG
jgi:hypothetical protein